MTSTPPTDTALLASIFAFLPQAVTVKDAELRYVFANERACELLGTSLASMQGNRVNDLLDAATARQFEKLDRQVLATGRTQRREYVSQVGEGERVVHCTKSLYTYPATGNHYVLTVLRDVTRERATATKLAETVNEMEAIFDNSLVGVLLVKDERTIDKANARLAEMFGYAPTELPGQSTQLLHLSQEHYDNFGQRYAELASTDELLHLEYPMRHASGELIWCRLSGKVLDTPHLERGVLWVIDDITDQKGVEAELERKVSERTAELEAANTELTREVAERKAYQTELQYMAEVFEHSLEGITITDAEGTILKVNPAFTRITGYTAEEAVGQNPSLLKSDRHSESFYRQMWTEASQKGAWEGEIWNRRKDGEVFPEWLSISCIRDEQAHVTSFVAVFHDITEFKQNEERIRFQAYHDPLTGLPNRSLLLDRLGVAIQHCKRKNAHLAVLFLDIDNFKNVNDSLGHHKGDQLLKAVGALLHTTMREEDTVARLGGDEFVVLLESLEVPADASQAAARILEAFHRTFDLDGDTVTVTPSIGITLYPDDGTTPEELVKNADMAMYRAKAKGRNTFQLYTSSLNESATRRTKLENWMRRALENEDFEAYLQPVIHFPTGAVTGVEALARWTLPDGTRVPPPEFIEFAEAHGLIEPLTRTIFLKAARQLKHLHSAGYSHLRMAFNISARHFDRPGVLDQLDELLEAAGLDAEYVELEITETALMADMQAARNTLDAVSERGMHISVDDFGTGYSSLAYLKALPISTLKVDRSFVRDLPDDGDDASIVEAVVSMAHKLNLKVVAEGVETPEQFHFLRRMGCDFFQGFLYTPPIPGPELLTLLTDSPFTMPPETP